MTSNSARPPLARGALDRDAATRADQELLAAAWSDPATRLLRLRGVEIPVIADDDGVRLSWRPAPGDPDAGDVFLGRIDGAPVFARLEPESAGETRAPLETWTHPFQVGARLTEAEREAVGVASALLRWHEAAGFSSRDGERTEPILGGWARIDAHGAEHFPRTDPAVIVLIEHEDRVLLGSNALWEPGRFSLLAGFVEAGESLEQAVQREVFEESGVKLGEITYVTSQPWPFPRSLMLGFRARLATGVDPEALVPDPTEISELRWFTREELRDPDDGLTLPMPLSIARWMIDCWVAEGGSRTDDTRGAS
ncbi:NAD(+) diphosphatase [Leucobacter sp. USCH14]|uniref:NAD(+) diphosphatase n=1 Tax=Leucobacter sp. USCH14 TaxID=3024838 RepID=UPI0030A48FAA